MILHLERKFTAPTETFISNQINFQTKYPSVAFTIDSLQSLSINAQVYESPSKSLLSGKILLPGQIKYFHKVFRELNPSLIHGHFLTDTSFFSPFTKKLSIPKLCSAYGYDISSFPKSNFGLGAAYLKRTFREYDKITAMSADMANDLLAIGCPQEKIIIHYHGIDTKFFDIIKTYEEKECLNLLTISSLIPKKGHITVLKAIKHLKLNSRQVKIKYNVVGKGYLLEELKKYCVDNDLQDDVTFLGPVKYGEGLLEQIKLADVFIHPSITDTKGNKEGIPGAIIEAMASGLPVISTYHAGIPEIIDNNVNGLLVKENDFLGVAEHLQALYESSELRQKIGSAAKSMALTKLDVREKTEDLKRIYERLL